jgi:hypothetical protein
MGREVRCTARHGDQSSEGKALLETDELVFRGEFRLRIPFREMASVEAVDGRLEVIFPEGTAVFDLGAEAERWAERIKNPPSLMDKLGVKPGARVAVLGIDDTAFWSELADREADLPGGGLAGAVGGNLFDIVIWGVEIRAELSQMQNLKKAIRPAGAIWTVWRRGSRELTEDHVRDAALAAGLVDVKVARFSATHSALKLVVRRARRPSR